MQKSNLPTKKVIALTLMAMTLVSSSVFANVYKWRDSRGRTQYSDTIPATSYSVVKRSELVNALQSKDVCTLPSAKPNAIAQSKLSKLSANFDFKVGASPKPNARLPITASLSKTRRVNTVGSVATIPAAVASITKFVATHAMPTIISPAVASPVIKTVTKPVVSSTPIPIVTSPAPTTVATNLPPKIVQAALMPAVDISKNMVPAVGYSELRLIPTTQVPGSPADGAFRLPCKVSHMSNDDPLIFPNMAGKSHHHTFFGNTSTNANSDLNNLRASGNSTCSGGIMNKSAYWIPSVIDTATGVPIQPTDMLVYYKSGDLGYVSPEPVTQPPTGLRMVAGNSKGTPADDATTSGHFNCNTPTGTTKWSKTIPNCNVGDSMTYHIDFPQCWDGKNLDSPNHKDHMAERVFISNNEMHCPVSHPFRIPAIAFNINYENKVANQMLKWRLASDNYPSTTAGGYSAHADWVNGWDEQLFARVIADCIQARLDCHATMAGKDVKMY